MYQRVKAYIEEHHMLEQQDKVIVGISGGADSVCLLFMLTKLRNEWKETGEGSLDITAVHVHHGLRGDSADADEQYVRKICGEWDVPLIVYHKEVRKLAKIWNMSEEEAGRKARREAFLEVRNQCDEPHVKIALAHHRNDDAETVLFHLCRGTDVRGLGGIAPVSGFWIRPLLNIRRCEIESYLEKMGISYCTDETNAENVYARNKLRNQVIPQLEQINAQAVLHISKAAQSVRELWSYVDTQVEAYKECCLGRKMETQVGVEKAVSEKAVSEKMQACQEKMRQTNLWMINKEQYEKVPTPLKSYVLHRIICEAAGHEKDIGAVHVRAVQELFERQVGRKIDLPYALTAQRVYEGVQFKRKADISENLSTSKELFHFRVFEREPGMEAFPEKTYTKWFDYDIIKNTVETRHRQAGDILTINKNGGKQRLKKYFINEKISQEERDNIWLVADGHEIMWVVGYRQSQSYQVTEYTKNILEIQFCKGENYGRDSKSIS